jgi:hypothetical protein
MFLTAVQAGEVALLIAEEWTRNRMGGGSRCEAISVLKELQDAIRAAREWRQAAQGL